MRTETLGEIKLFNTICPIRYDNEVIQIAFRIAKMRELPEVCAIDDDSEMDETVFEHPSADVQEAMNHFAECDGQHADSIVGTFSHIPL